MSIRKKLIIALVALGALPHMLTGLYVHSLVDKIIQQESLAANSASHSIGLFFLFITLAGMFGFAILGIVLSREITSPISNILKHLKKIALDDTPFDTAYTGNELKALERTVNDIFDKLYKGKSELRQANLKLEEENSNLTDQSRILSVHNDLFYTMFSSNSIKLEKNALKDVSFLYKQT